MLIGAHESIAGGIELAFARAQEHRGKSLQIFTRNARGWACKPLGRLERSAFGSESRRTSLPAVAHGSYLANLGSSDPLLREKSLACVAEELSRCNRLEIPLLIIHPGTNSDARQGLRLIARGLDQIHAEMPKVRSRICLEVTAGQGSCLGWRFEHLAEILTLCASSERLSVCLDTCHLFAAGYDLSTRRGYEGVMAEFDRLVGLKRVECFHLNDSQRSLGCRVDRHADIGKGAIGLVVFRCLVNDSRFEHTVGVLETPNPERYGRSIRLLESLRRK
jgi:deoxyribonuclease-4